MRERIRKMSGWLCAFLVLVLVLLSVPGCGSGQGTGEIPVRTQETHTLLSGESQTAVQAAGAERHSGGDTLPSGESQTALREAGTTERPDRDIFADTGTETWEVSGTEESETPGTKKSEILRTEEPENPEMEESEAPGIEESAAPGLAVEEGESYTSKEEVALHLHLFGELPSNFITKKEAEALGWKKEPGEAGELQNVAPGKSIGGDRFGNYEKLLPEKKGRKYFECDINYVKGKRGAERIIYSNDGLIFYTGDHYKTFEKLYPEDNGSDRPASSPR